MATEQRQKVQTGRTSRHIPAQSRVAGPQPLNPAYLRKPKSYDYISLFASCFDIPVSLGSLFQRIASIYDRFYLSRLNKLFEEN